MRKKILSLFCTLALCLSLLPATALAADNDTVYVGGEALTGTASAPVYATTDDSGKVTVQSSYTEQDSWQIKWDGSTLTLDGAKIKGANSSESISITVGIYAFNSSGDVSLNIALQGVNEIFESSYGIWVYSSSSSTNAGNATLTIEGEGSLNASGSSSGIQVQSNSGDAALTIQNADVTAENSSSSGDGVTVRAGSSSSASLSVDGGSLTATGKNENGAGIRYTFGSSSSGSGKPSLTVSGNAMVKASGDTGGITSNSSTVTPSGTGIVFNNGTGTVYGDVTLQEDLTIGEGESLKLDSGASLNTGEYTLKVDGGTLTGDVTGTVIYKVTGVSLNKTSTELTVGQSETLTATITPDNATNKNVTWSSDNQNVATADANGNVTAVGAGTAQITVTTADGSFTDTCQVTVNAATVPVTGVTLDKAELTLTEGNSEALVATITPDNAANKTVTWTSSNPSVATVNNGEVTAVSAGEATITVTTEDGSFTAECIVTVRGDVPDRPVNIPDTHEIELIAGEGGEARTSLTNASAGSTITVTVTPNDGYELDCITVNGERISGTSFTMPAHDVTVRVYFSGVLPFADVDKGAWYYDAVSYVRANGLMDGVSATTFAPDANMTRAMVWTVLARIDGEEIFGTSWAEDARAWAMESGVSDGTDPSCLVTREQFAAMLHRYAGEPAVSGSLSAYTDAASVSEWATDAMLWATQNGIITGTTAATLAPQGTATRAQAAAMLMRFAER